MEKGYLHTQTITSSQMIDFDLETNGKGVRDLTIVNVGQVAFEVAGLRIQPKETYMVESQIALLNTNFTIEFDKDKDAIKKAVLSYVVIRECN